MAVYRPVQTVIWQDGDMLDLNTIEKLIFIYFITNSKTTQCGIYELPFRIIETETGLDIDTIKDLLYKFEYEYKKIKYNYETKEIFIINWMKHNKATSPKVVKCIEKEIKTVKSMEFIKLFLDECRKYGYEIDTVSKECEDKNKCIDRVSIEVSESENSSKHHYGEKEKEKEKQKVKEEEKEYIKRKGEDDSVCKFKKLYEQNVGVINPIVANWLIEVSEDIEYELFKRAIEISVDKGKVNKGYISGILRQWRENNIKSISDLSAYEVGQKNQRGISEHERYNVNNRKYEYAKALEREDESIYQRPDLDAIREVQRIERGEG